MTKTKQCWECLKRRLVCDFSGPSCRKCRKRGVDCPGYGPKPLVWKANLGVAKAQPLCANNSPEYVANSSDTASTISSDNESETSSAPTDYASPYSLDLLELKLFSSHTKNEECHFPIEAIEYYNTCLSADMMTLKPGNQFCPYFVRWSTVENLPLSMIHLLVSVSLKHRLLQSQASHKTNQMAGYELVPRFYRYRISAVQLLNHELSTKSFLSKDQMVVCVICFLLAELQQAISTSWVHHSYGAMALIDSRGGFQQLLESSPQLKPFLTYVILIDVVGMTTSPTLSDEQTNRQLEFINLLPELYGEGLTTTFPCPLDLFTEIIHINRLRSIVQSLKVANSAALAQLASDILDRICAFNTDRWAERIICSLAQREAKAYPQCSSTPSYSETMSLLPSESTWRLLANVFRQAVMLYCLRAFIEMQQRLVKHQASIVASQQSLMSSLEEIFDSPTPTFMNLQKTLLWPLLIAGLGVRPRTHEATFIQNKLVWLSTTLGTSSSQLAKSLLEDFWQGKGFVRLKQSISEQSWRWEDVFKSPHAFVV